MLLESKMMKCSACDFGKCLKPRGEGHPQIRKGLYTFVDIFRSAEVLSNNNYMDGGTVCVSFGRVVFTESTTVYERAKSHMYLVAGY